VRIHIDWPWSFDVREYGAPVRAYVHTERWSYIIGAKSQRWDPEFGYGMWETPRYKRVTRHPNREAMCRTPLEDRVTCPLLSGHPGRHWNWKRGWKQTEAYEVLGQ
jgi:hypothetical protein